MRSPDLIELLKLMGCGLDSSVRAPEVVEPFLQCDKLFLGASVVQHVFADELGQVLHVLDAYGLIEHGHGRAVAQVGVQKEHGLEFLVIGREGIKGEQGALLDDLS